MNMKAKRKLNMGEKAELAMREAVTELIAEHRKTNMPLVIWKDNKAVKVSPFKVDFPTHETQSSKKNRR